MGEKKRWFDPKNKNCITEPIPPPTPMLNTSALSDEDIVVFMDMLRDCSSKSPLRGPLRTVFYHLLRMPPRIRLARNLKVVLDQLARGPIESIMRDGLNLAEQEALIALELLGSPMEIKLTAQALLNINERYQLAMSLEEAFR